MPDHDAKLLNRFRKDLDPDEKRYTFGSQLCDDPVILEATDKKTGLKLAVKQQVLDIQTEDQRKEVEREVLSLEKIANDHVIRMHKHVLVRGEKTLYQFMDLFRETPLQRFVEELPSEEAHFDTYLELTRQVLEGLAAIHKAEVIHRDLKPANIFVGQKEKTPDVRIMDFGLSVPPYTPYSKTYGTPGYTDPSIKTGSRATTRADIFSLGVILYDLYAGNLRKGRTIGAESLSQKIAAAVKRGDQAAAEQICKVAPETLQDTPEKYRKPLAGIIEKCLHHIDIARYSHVSTIQLDFHLLTSPEKQQPIFDALKQNAVLGISRAADAYHACVPLQFREQSLASAILNDVHVALISKLQTCSIGALLPYLRMLQETNRLDQEKDKLKVLISEPLEKLIAFIPKAEPAADWLKALESLTPAGKEVWGRLTKHFHTPLDTLTTLLRETADYETKNSVEACTKRGYEFLGYTPPESGQLWKHDPAQVVLAEKEFSKALDKKPDHEEARKGLILAKLFLADRELMMKRPDDAIKKLATAFQHKPTTQQTIWAYLMLESAYLMNNNFKDASNSVGEAHNTRAQCSDEERAKLSANYGNLSERWLLYAFKAKDMDLKKCCEAYVKITPPLGLAAAKAYHYLFNWKSAFQNAAATIGHQPDNEEALHILEDSLRQLKLDELVNNMKRSYNVDIRPILDVPLVNCGVDRTAEQITKDANTMNVAFHNICKGMPQEALDMLVSELRQHDYARSEYLVGYAARSVKSLHHPEHFMLPARAQKRRIYLTGALIGAAVVSGAFGLAKGLHIWPFNQPTAYQQK